MDRSLDKCINRSPKASTGRENPIINMNIVDPLATFLEATNRRIHALANPNPLPKQKKNFHASD
jgi:hypothetical protein